MFKKNLAHHFIGFITILSVSSIAHATNMHQILISSASAKWSANQGGFTTTMKVNFVVNNSGPNHICQLKWTKDFWVTYNTVNAKFINTSGSSENWQAVQSVPGQYTGTAEYAVTCTDLTGQQQVVSVQFGSITTPGLTLQSPMGSTPFGW